MIETRSRMDITVRFTSVFVAAAIAVHAHQSM